MKVSKLRESDIFSYLSFGLVAKVIPFFASLILVKLLIPEEYGVISAFMSIMALSASFINFGVNQMVVREKQFLTNIEFSTLLSSSRLLSLALLLLVIPFTSLLFSFIPDWEVEFKWVLIALILSWFSSFTDLIAKILVVNTDAFSFGVFDVFKQSIIPLLSISFILFYPGNALEARVSGIVLGLIISTWYGLLLINKYITFQQPQLSEVKRILSYGLKVLPQVFSNWVKMGADKVLLVSLVGLSELGAYSFTFSICTVIMVFGNAINNSYISSSIRLYKDRKIMELRINRRRSMIITCIVYSFAAIFLIAFSKVWWPSGYKISDLSMLLIFASFLFQLIYLLYMKYFLFKQNMGELGIVNLLLSGIYLIFLIFPIINPSIEYVVLCFTAYSFFLMLYVAARTIYLERIDFDM